MPPRPRQPAAAPLLADARGLVRDIMRFGGRRLPTAVALMVAGGVLEGVGLALLVPILSLLAPGADGRWQTMVTDPLSRIGLDQPGERLAAVLAAFCLLVALRAVVLTARDRSVHALTLDYTDHRRLGVIGDLARARWSALSRLRHARIGHVLSSEIGRLDIATATLMRMATSGIMLAVQAALMIALSPVVAGLAAVCACAGLAMLVPLARRSTAAGRRISRHQFRIAGEAAHFLGGLKLAVAHDTADAFTRRVGAQGVALRAERDDQQRFRSRVAIAWTSTASLVGAAIVLGAVLSGVPTIPLLAALVILVRMSGPVRTLQMDAQLLFGVLPAFAVLGDLHRDLAEAAPAVAVSPRPAPRGPIRFEGVDFRYPGAASPVFTGLDLRIEPGEMVGVSGPSGVGKTTLVDLLTGLLEPSGGRITIAGEPLGPHILADWRRRLAYVAQDSYLVNDSIRANLAWGDPPPPNDALRSALAVAQATDLVAALPDGLDTMAGERGTRLSGGERQRVALARAVLRAPGLLILDEATNAIDIATERAAIAGLRRALPDTAILVIAHRDETLAACDRVIALAPGTGASGRAGDGGAAG